VLGLQSTRDRYNPGLPLIILAGNPLNGTVSGSLRPAQPIASTPSRTHRPTAAMSCHNPQNPANVALNERMVLEPPFLERV
jgi:hypothetical protein